MAFCFDEACEYILSMKTTKEVTKNGKVYLEEAWVKEPNWIDEDKKDKKKTSSNGDLIAEMKKNLEKFK